MVTLFTTAKKFHGKNGMNQLNALMSWIAAPIPVEIIMFDHVEGENIEELKQSSKITFVEEIKTNENGIPRIDFMFDTASTLAKYDILCYLNADIILPPSFFEDILDIHKKVKKDYLVVGQRIDVDVDNPLTFSDNWLSKFWQIYLSPQVHTPSGSDFFVFPKSQYSMNNMPDLLVGRPGWDLWMIYNGLKRKLKVIDLSFSTMVIHQNHDYNHKQKKTQKVDDNHNYQYLPQHLKYKYQLAACNYYYSHHSIKKNYARGDIKKYVNYRNWTYGDSFTDRQLNKLISIKLNLLQKINPSHYQPN